MFQSYGSLKYPLKVFFSPSIKICEKIRMIKAQVAKAYFEADDIQEEMSYIMTL